MSKVEPDTSGLPPKEGPLKVKLGKDTVTKTYLLRNEVRPTARRVCVPPSSNSLAACVCNPCLSAALQTTTCPALPLTVLGRAIDPHTLRPPRPALLPLAPP